MLDGLDEAGNTKARRDIIQALRFYGCTTKVLITSRYSEDISKALDEANSCTGCKSPEGPLLTWCKTCKTNPVCEQCHEKEAPRNCVEQGHLTGQEHMHGWTRFEFVAKSGDIREYVFKRAEVSLSDIPMDENMRELVVSRVLEKSENM